MMTLATRLRHQVNMHADWVRNETRIAAIYEVQGTDKRLVVEAWIAHEHADNPEVLVPMLEMMDGQAQLAAVRPDDYPTAHMVCA